MTQHQDQFTGVIKNYTFTTLLSFSIMFLLFVSLSRCNGSYRPVSENSNATEHTNLEHKK
jgi:hypothetical protein